MNSRRESINDQTASNLGSTHCFLSAAERAQLRNHLESERRVQWLFAVIKIWLGWISGTMIAVYAIWEYLGKFLKLIGGP